MKIYLNSKEKEFHGSTLQDLITQFDLPSRGTAIAVGEKVIPRSKHAEYYLSEGDKIMLITATYGG